MGIRRYCTFFVQFETYICLIVIIFGLVLVFLSLCLSSNATSLLLQGPLVLRDGNALIRSPTLSQPALTVAAVPRQGQSFTSSVLALSLEGAGGGASDQASFMQASRGSLNAGAVLSEVVFEVDAKGGISSSGGVRVSSGGVQVIN